MEFDSEQGNDPEVISALEAVFGLYFAEDDTETVFSTSDPHISLALDIYQMFLGPMAPLVQSVDWARATVVRINFDDFFARSTLADLYSALKEEPTMVICAISLSLCILRAKALPPYTPAIRLRARLQNVRPIRSIRDIKADAIDAFLAVKGNVVRVGPIRPLVVAMSFECCKCRELVRVAFEQGKFEAPRRCSATGGCRSQKFDPVRESAETVDWQRVKIQEVETDIADAGRVPRSVDVELTDDLVDGCVPGDIVHVSGMVRSVNADVAAGRSAGRARHLFVLYLEAHSIVTAKVSSTGGGGGDDSKQFSEKDLQLVRAVASVPDPFALVVASLCPTIFGNETVKAALVLGLFGGTHMPTAAAMLDGGAASVSTGTTSGNDPAVDAAAGGTASLDKFKLSVRADPHVLVVGDPGLGKSQMLRAAAAVSPRGVYVCGNTASGSGLTVTMVRDPDSGDFGLEAGALVLSDQGICCIDEFDKMGKEHNALLEAMEQQRISIAKAGIVASLSARTSVLAAANPVGGHYDRSKTVVENLRMSAPLLSRFDLVFIILDKPDEERDRQLSTHVMGLHHRAASAGRDQSAGSGGKEASQSDPSGHSTAASQHGTRHVGATADSGSVDSSMMRALDPANTSHSSMAGDAGIDALFASVQGAQGRVPPSRRHASGAAVPASQSSVASRAGRNSAVARAIAERIAEADERRATQEAGEVVRGLAASQARRGRQVLPGGGVLPPMRAQLDAMLVGGACMGAAKGVFGAAGGSGPASSSGMSLVLETEDIERRLRRGVQRVPDPMPPVCLRKYVAYARRFCHPVLSPAAAAVLQDFYLDLRQKHGDDDTTPITTRQLESMVRLAQARAKIDLRETVTRSDAVDVIQLMRRSLLDVAMDGMGTIDFSRSVGAGGMSMQRQVKTLIGALNKLARQRGSNRFTRDEIEQVVTEMRMQINSLTDLIETMNQQSYLLKKGHRVYQLLTSDG